MHDLTNAGLAAVVERGRRSAREHQDCQNPLAWRAPLEASRETASAGWRARDGTNLITATNIARGEITTEAIMRINDIDIALPLQTVRPFSLWSSGMYATGRRLTVNFR